MMGSPGGEHERCIVHRHGLKIPIMGDCFNSNPTNLSLLPSCNIINPQLPVYLLSKRGGNLKQTKLRRIEGNINVLRTDLQKALGLEEKDVMINQLTQQIIVKGHKKFEVLKFLEDHKF